MCVHMYVHVCVGTYAHVWTCADTKGVIPQESFTLFCEVGSLTGTQNSAKPPDPPISASMISAYLAFGGHRIHLRPSCWQGKHFTTELPSPALKAPMTKNHTTVTESGSIHVPASFASFGTRARFWGRWPVIFALPLGDTDIGHLP